MTTAPLARRLTALRDALPPGGSVTLDREALSELLAAETVEAEPVGDLSIEQVAKALGKAPSTVRNYVAAGELKGYRFKRQWRFTREAVTAFERGQAATTLRQRRASEPADLSDWRRHRGTHNQGAATHHSDNPLS